jgi:hypothetical protein
MSVVCGSDVYFSYVGSLHVCQLCLELMCMLDVWGADVFVSHVGS